MRANERRTRNVERVHDAIAPLIRDRSVLHLGCAAHDATKIEGNEPWLHELLDETAATCLGVDLLDEEVARMRAAGYDAACADVQDMHLGEEFETIVAGELIEHLVDFDGFLRSIDRHLADGGRLVLTTPNAMAVHWTGLRLLDVPFINNEHTCWFDRTTLRQLLDRYGFALTRTGYVGDCSFRPLADPLFTLGWLVETTLPDRIGKSTLIAVARRSTAE